VILHDSNVYIFKPSKTTISAMTERPHELGDFKGLGQFEAKF